MKTAADRFRPFAWWGAFLLSAGGCGAPISPLAVQPLAEVTVRSLENDLSRVIKQAIADESLSTPGSLIST